MGIVVRQGLLGGLLIYLGFALGAFNILFLFKEFLSTEEVGLVFFIVALAKIILNAATFGNNSILNKFFPYYNHLNKEHNDFLKLSFFLPLIGICMLVPIWFVARDSILDLVKDKAVLFAEYYWWMLPFAIFFILYSTLETFSATKYKTVFPAFLREIGIRILTTGLILLYGYSFIGFQVFIWLYTFIYSLLFVLLLWHLYKEGHLTWSVRWSPVTKRLRPHMTVYGLYIYGGLIISALAENADTLIIGFVAGLQNVGIYQTGHYVATILQVPYRSLSAIAAPLIAQAWKDKNMELIKTLYIKTSLNQLLAGIFLFGVIWVNIDFMLVFLGEKYNGVKEVVLLLGISRIIDLAFGQNSEILHNSKYWTFNFISYVLLVIAFLPLNYFLVKSFGMVGAAFSNIGSFLLFNVTRFIFIWVKMKMQPFSYRTILCILFGVSSWFIITLIFDNLNAVSFNTVLIKSISFSFLFIAFVYFTNLSEDANQLVHALIEKLLRFMAGAF